MHVDPAPDKPYSSVLYLSNAGAEQHYKDPIDGTVVLHAQIIEPGDPTLPSSLVAAAQIATHPEHRPNWLDHRELFGLTRDLAAAALLAKHWPSDKRALASRHALYEWAIRGGKDPGWISQFFDKVIVACGGKCNPELRRREAEETKKRLDQNKNTRGYKTLVGLLPQPVIDQVGTWLEICGP